MDSGTTQTDALELYCSPKGYDLLYSLIFKALRTEQADDERLLAAAFLVEWVTIDLHNLRLSQIGDSRYGNFEGTTHRGMPAPRSALAEYEEISQLKDVSKRNFARTHLLLDG